MTKSVPVIFPVDPDPNVAAGPSGRFINFLSSLRYEYTDTLNIGVCQVESAAELRSKHNNFDWMTAIIIERSHHLLDPGDIKDRFPIPQVYSHGNYEFYNKEQAGQIYFPWYFAEACTDSSIVNINYNRMHPAYQRANKTYTFSCLNRNPKLERCYLYLHLYQTKFFKETLTSFYPSFTWNLPINFEDMGEYMGTGLRDYFQTEIYPTLPHCCENDMDMFKSTPGYFTRDISHLAFSDAYVNIISEHSYTDKFLSEKSVKPLAAAQLFLMAGPQHAIRHIEELGFDVFRDYIDHDYYDNSPDAWTRIHRMLEVAEDLYAADPAGIYRATYLRRERNREHLFSEDLRNRCYRSIRQWIRNELDPH